MYKRLIAVLATIALLSGCLPVSPRATGNPIPSLQPTVTGAPSVSGIPGNTPSPAASGSVEEIKALLPDRAGFKWRYFGFAEYAMEMELKSIGQSNGVLSYGCEGKVADMSGGAEAKGDFGVKVTYRAMPGVLKQELKGEKALDNVYPDLELIRAPLQKGAKWVQAVRDGKGKNASLSCSIDDVKESKGRKVYFVTYRTEGSDYYEKREITQGFGVTAFDRLYEFENINELIGYRLSDQIQTASGWEQWLPQLGHEYTYFGLAEYGHKGKLAQLSNTGSEALFEYRGVYSDGVGTPDKFVIRYYFDKVRGTCTEQVMSNARSGKKEVNSKLHNLVILRFPLSKGSAWSHKAKLNGKSVIVHAVITEYDEAKGLVKVRYTAKNAAGYYNDTYVEERTFEKGFGLTGFSSLMPGRIGISAANAKDPNKLSEAIAQHSFGYSLNKQS